MARRTRQSQGASRSSKASNTSWQGALRMLRLSTRLKLLLKALFVWALFTVGGWITIPIELVPLFSHCVGLGFYLIIVTQKARWLIPVSLGGFCYLGIVYFTVPPTAWAFTTHILGYAGLVSLVVTHISLKWVGADLQPQAERLLEGMKDVLSSVDMLPTAERLLESVKEVLPSVDMLPTAERLLEVALLLRDRLTVERLLDGIAGSIADGINGIDVQRAWAYEVLRCRLGSSVDWLTSPGSEWLKPPAAMTAKATSAANASSKSNAGEADSPVTDGSRGIGLAIGALLARALALAADCPGGISSALGSTAEALLARALSLYPERCIKFLLDILAAADDVDDDDEGDVLDDAGWFWQCMPRHRGKPCDGAEGAEPKVVTEASRGPGRSQALIGRNPREAGTSLFKGSEQPLASDGSSSCLNAIGQSAAGFPQPEQSVGAASVSGFQRLQTSAAATFLPSTDTSCSTSLPADRSHLTSLPSSASLYGPHLANPIAKAEPSSKVETVCQIGKHLNLSSEIQQEVATSQCQPDSSACTATPVSSLACETGVQRHSLEERFEQLLEERLRQEQSARERAEAIATAAFTQIMDLQKQLTALHAKLAEHSPAISFSRGSFQANATAASAEDKFIQANAVRSSEESISESQQLPKSSQASSFHPVASPCTPTESTLILTPSEARHLQDGSDFCSSSSNRARCRETCSTATAEDFQVKANISVEQSSTDASRRSSVPSSFQTKVMSDSKPASGSVSTGDRYSSQACTLASLDPEALSAEPACSRRSDSPTLHDIGLGHLLRQCNTPSSARRSASTSLSKSHAPSSSTITNRNTKGLDAISTRSATTAVHNSGPPHSEEAVLGTLMYIGHVDAKPESYAKGRQPTWCVENPSNAGNAMDAQMRKEENMSARPIMEAEEPLHFTTEHAASGHNQGSGNHDPDVDICDTSCTRRGQGNSLSLDSSWRELGTGLSTGAAQHAVAVRDSEVVSLPPTLEMERRARGKLHGRNEAACSRLESRDTAEAFSPSLRPDEISGKVPASSLSGRGLNPSAQAWTGVGAPRRSSTIIKGRSSFPSVLIRFPENEERRANDSLPAHLASCLSFLPSEAEVGCPWSPQDEKSQAARSVDQEAPGGMPGVELDSRDWQERLVDESPTVAFDRWSNAVGHRPRGECQSSANQHLHPYLGTTSPSACLAPYCASPPHPAMSSMWETPGYFVEKGPSSWSRREFANPSCGESMHPMVAPWNRLCGSDTTARGAGYGRVGEQARRQLDHQVEILQQDCDSLQQQLQMPDGVGGDDQGCALEKIEAKLISTLAAVQNSRGAVHARGQVREGNGKQQLDSFGGCSGCGRLDLETSMLPCQHARLCGACVKANWSCALCFGSVYSQPQINRCWEAPYPVAR